jgi:hypothetical protein
MEPHWHCDYFFEDRNGKCFMSAVNVPCHPRNLGSGHISSKSLTPDWLTKLQDITKKYVYTVRHMTNIQCLLSFSSLSVHMKQLPSSEWILKSPFQCLQRIIFCWTLLVEYQIQSIFKSVLRPMK